MGGTARETGSSIRMNVQWIVLFMVAPIVFYIGLKKDGRL